MSVKFRGINATGNIKFANTASGSSGSSDPHYASVIGLYNAEQPTVINAYDNQSCYAPNVSVIPEAAHRGTGGYQVLSGSVNGVANGIYALVAGSPIGAADLQPITQSFTIEGWFKFTGDSYTLFEHRHANGTGWGFFKQYGSFSFKTTDSGGGSASYHTLSPIVEGEWFHIALCYRYTEPGYAGVGFRIFKNGIEQSAEQLGVLLTSASSRVLFNPWGNADDIRITSGVSRYTVDFDPNQILY